MVDTHMLKDLAPLISKRSLARAMHSRGYEIKDIREKLGLPALIVVQTIHRFGPLEVPITSVDLDSLAKLVKDHDDLTNEEHLEVLTFNDFSMLKDDELLNTYEELQSRFAALDRKKTTFSEAQEWLKAIGSCRKEIEQREIQLD